MTPETVPPGVCHHCLRKQVARRAFGIAGMRRLLCEERCAPAWDRFVSAVETLHAAQVWKPDARAAVDVPPTRVTVAVAEPEPADTMPEPPVRAPQMGLFGGAA